MELLYSVYNTTSAMFQNKKIKAELNFRNCGLMRRFQKLHFAHLWDL